MATKLRNLKIKKVDFVDEGANPDADIKMRKKKIKKNRKIPAAYLKSCLALLEKRLV